MVLVWLRLQANARGSRLILTLTSSQPMHQVEFVRVCSVPPSEIGQFLNREGVKGSS